MNEKHIVVGIDGSAVAARALDWAAAEAVERGLGLIVAHVCGPIDGADVSTPTVETEQERYGDELLRDTAATLRAGYPTVTPTTLRLTGRPVELLAELSETAAMIVLGSNGHGRLAGMLFGSVTQGLAMQTHCPVVVIGQHTAAPAGDRPVVVGVSDSPGGREALRFAFDEAAVRGTSVRAVRAYSVMDHAPYTTTGVPLPGLRTHEARYVRTVLDEVRADCPEWARVPVEVTIADELRVDALRRAAVGAGLLVVGLHRRPRLGSVAAAFLHHSPCPVAVVAVPVAVRAIAG